MNTYFFPFGAISCPCTRRLAYHTAPNGRKKSEVEAFPNRSSTGDILAFVDSVADLLVTSHAKNRA